jgi:metallo-beta-lactamase family protein
MTDIFHGQDVAVNAEIVSLPGMSAHANALRQRIERELGWIATVLRLGQTVEIRP